MCPKKAPDPSALGLTEEPGLFCLTAHARVKHNSESERRSPSSEDDRDERESRAEIQNAEDYNEIFQPKNSISEAALPPARLTAQRLAVAVSPKLYLVSAVLYRAGF